MSLTAQLDLADTVVVDQAIASATAAAAGWLSASLTQRTRVLFAFRQLLAEHAGEVVAVISPFNFPAMVPLWFVPVAIAAGNAVVLKPSEKDPSAALVAAGVEAGADLVVDGRLVEPDGDPNGYWLGPTLFDRVTPEMSIYTDEIFGPVLSIVHAGSFDEGLALINANPYGNGTAIFTHDGGAERRFETEVQVGMVGTNVPIPVPMSYYSFGGWKSSLLGDSHAHGADGFHFFTRGKVVTTRWPDPSHGRVDLGFPTHS